MAKPDKRVNKTTSKGRPTKKTKELTDQILYRISQGESLRSICRDVSMPNRSTIIDWRSNDPDFSNQYAQAREAGFDVTADEILDIADEPIEFLREDPKAANAEVQHRRLKIDTRKWLLSKLCANKYGDKSGVEINANSVSIKPSDVDNLSIEDAKKALME